MFSFGQDVAHIGVAFVGAPTMSPVEATAKFAPVMAASACKKIFRRCFSSHMRQVKSGRNCLFGIHLLFEQQAYLFALDMNGRHDDMAGWKVHQLQDAFTQIGFHYIYAFRQQERVQFAFFRESMDLLFDETGHLMFFKQSIDDLSVFFCVFSPMYDGTVCRGVLSNSISSSSKWLLE